MDRSNNDSEYERHRHQIDDARLAHSDWRSYIDFANEAAISLTATATKGFLLINGGAAIAMLGFIATVSNGSGPLALNISASIGALVWFAWGVLAAASCSGLAYCVMYLQVAVASNVTYTWEHPYIVGKPISKGLRWFTDAVHITAVLTGVASLVFFWLGVSDIAGAVTDSPPKVPGAETK